MFDLRNQKGESVPLAMQNLVVRGDIQPFGAVLEIEHAFRVACEQPVEAI